MLESNRDLIDFNAQNAPELTDTLSSQLPCLFDTFPLPFELFLIFLAPQVLYLYILWQPWDQRLLQRALVSFTGGWWLEVRPGLWFDFCSWATIVSGDFSVDRARKHAFKKYKFILLSFWSNTRELFLSFLSILHIYLLYFPKESFFFFFLNLGVSLAVQ